jgi:hypothetical protein
MATLARLYDFTPGSVIRSSEVDDEFNQIINLLNGTTTSVQAFLQLSDPTLATLKVNQSVTGAAASVLSLLAGGVEKVKVDGLGRIHSLVARISTDPAASLASAASNAPLVITSTALVPNLNADMVDGLHASELISVASGSFTQNITISNTEPYLRFEDTTTSENDVEFILLNDGTDQQLTLRRVSDQQKIQRWNVDQGTAQFHNVVVLRSDAGADIDITVAVGGSVPDQHLTPKKYVDAKKVQWAVCAYFNNEIQTTMKTGQLVIPLNVNDFFVTHLKIVYQAGTPSGNSTVSVAYRRAGSSTTLGAVTLTSATAVNTVVTNDIADVELETDDIVTFTVTAAGGHNHVSVTLSGYQKVSVN